MSDNTADFSSLRGQFLVAMPGIDDMRFEKSVIYLFEHSPQGAAGLVINRPAEKITFPELLDQLKIEYPPSGDLPPLLLGGPDKFTNGFVLHSNDYQTDSTNSVTPEVSLTSTQDILVDIVRRKGPFKKLIALGCATWIPGQLEDELMGNVWLTTPATSAILFDVPFNQRWASVLQQMGINAHFLSSDYGKA